MGVNSGLERWQKTTVTIKFAKRCCGLVVKDILSASLQIYHHTCKFQTVITTIKVVCKICLMLYVFFYQIPWHEHVVWCVCFWNIFQFVWVIVFLTTILIIMNADRSYSKEFKSRSIIFYSEPYQCWWLFVYLETSKQFKERSETHEPKSTTKQQQQQQQHLCFMFLTIKTMYYPSFACKLYKG